MKWSETTWERIKPIYSEILNMPFITKLTDGSLPMEQFQYYIRQDSAYLENFGRALSLIAARAHEVEDILSFSRFAEGAIVVENALHESFFNEYNIEKNTQISPVTHHYTHYLKSTAALDQVEIAMAAVLPCFWIYKAVGDVIYNNQNNLENPYKKWIETYSGEEFGILVEQAITICDRVAATCTTVQRERMHEAFYTATKLEFMFSDSASNLRKWSF